MYEIYQIMGHNHNHGNAEKNIAVAFVLNCFFVVVELVGGVLTNSIAILSDALHDFGDCLSLGIAWGLQKKADKKRDNKYSYGYKRFSLLGTVFLSGVLAVSSVIVIIEAVKRLAAPQPVDAHGMLWIAVFGIVINGAAALRLKKGDSLTERAVFLHIMEDVLGWVAVLLVSFAMIFVNVPVLDPLLSIAISVWVLVNVYRNMRDTFRILLQAVPDGVDLREVTKEIESIDGVCSIHDLHIWTQDGTTHVMTLHVVGSASETNRIKEEIYDVTEKYNIHHITMEFELAGEDCHHKCE